jgi:hypothetical protein
MTSLRGLAGHRALQANGSLRIGEADTIGGRTNPLLHVPVPIYRKNGFAMPAKGGGASRGMGETTDEFIRPWVRDVCCCSPSLRPAAFPPPSPPPICRRLCSRLHRYYAAVRLLTSPATASPPRLPVAARLRHSGLGEMRSPRFRRVPFMRNGVSDHGRAVAPRITVRNILPSALSTASASAGLSLSRLNIPLHMIAVYASQPSSPPTTQHSLD